MLHEGKYWGSILASGMGESNNATPYLYIEFDVTHEAGPDGQYIELDHRTQRTVYFYLSDAARDYSLDKLDRLRDNINFKEYRGEIDLERANVTRDDGELDDAMELYR